MSFEIYSHTNDNLLSEHLFYVAKVMEEKAIFDKELAFILGICHDFGKLTSYFQNEKIARNGKKYKEKSNHTLISIHFAIAFLKHCGIEDEKVFLISIFVINHHSDLRDMEELISSFSQRTKEELIPQFYDLQKRINIIKNVYQKELIELMRQHNIYKNIQNRLLTFDFSSFLTQEYLKKSVKTLRKLRNKFSNKNDLDNIFLKISYLYSLLIFADRNMASKLPFAYEAYKNNAIFFKIPSKLIEKKILGFKTSKDDIKQQLFDILDKETKNDLNNKNIFTVTAPTGAGKTLATLNFAFKLKERYKKEKIIYALPLTNIIEQNYNVIKEILKEFMKDEFINNEFDYLIKHHYLADYKINEKIDIKDVLKTVENWDSEIVVTTFIQLFYAFSSNKASYLYRFSALQNSVIILDEPQVLNAEHWLLIRKMIFWLVKYLNIKIILMTATKPLIFKDGEYLELAKSIDFKHFIQKRGSRHKIIPSLEINHSLETFADFVSRKIEDKNSVLVVLNTKKSSIGFFNLIREIKKDYIVYYLSTNLVPYHRKEVIDEIKKNMQNKKVIVVSTQVIEAGVDLDFEIGFRDLAPLDSIIQTAGRINRYFLRQNSEPIYVVNIQKENGKQFGEYVYEKEYLEITKSLLNEEKEEFCFEELTEIYFKKIQQYNQLKAQSIENLINKLNFQTLSKNFQIIKKSDHTVPVFLEVNEEAKNLYQKYKTYKERINTIKDYQIRLNMFKEMNYFKRKLYNYIVNVNKNNVITDNSEWLTVVKNENLSYCYDFDENLKVGTGINEDNFGSIQAFF